MRTARAWLPALVSALLLGSAVPAASAQTAPTLSINDVAVLEPASGTVQAAFTVYLSAPMGQPVTVYFQTFNGTANTDDYVPTSGNVTIPAQATSAAIVVGVIGDTVTERDETFFLSISSSSVVVADDIGQGTILSDDLPLFSAADVTKTEGNVGSSNAVFTVTLSPPVAWATSVQYQTLPTGANRATNGPTCGGSVDYRDTSGTLSFAPNQASTTVTVPVCGDARDEADEQFEFELFGPTDATVPFGIFRAPTIGTIADDDPLPSLTISGNAISGPISVAEGDSGNSNVVFAVTLSAASGRDVTVHFAATNGTATGSLACSGSVDFLNTSGTLTIPAGQANGTFGIPVCGDTAVEGNESFTVTLSSPTNATVGNGVGTAIIVDDDGKTGTFLLVPGFVTVNHKDRLSYALTWTVPAPEVWRDLETIGLRIRDGKGTILLVRWDEAANTFSVFDPKSGAFGPPGSPGDPTVLQGNGARLYLADTTVVGSGPTGPGVTLNLSLGFGPKAAGRTFVVEAGARDDFGHQDPFLSAGKLTVR